MVREKYRKIKKKVFLIVKKEEPVSTAIVARKLKVNWATAQRSLQELEREMKVRGKSVSGRNIWTLLRK